MTPRIPGECTRGTTSAEYRAWMNMRARCSPANQNARYYAARGIAVCERWSSYQAFALCRVTRAELAERFGVSCGYVAKLIRGASRSAQTLDS